MKIRHNIRLRQKAFCTWLLLVGNRFSGLLFKKTLPRPMLIFTA